MNKPVEISPVTLRLVLQFGDMLLVERGLSQHTVAAYTTDLKLFARWLQISQCDVLSVGYTHIMAFLSVRLQSGSSPRSAARMLSSLRQFYGYLLRERLITSNPTQLIDSPNIGRPLPITLTESEVQALLAAPDIETNLGLRDRAMLELLYGCGLRVTELVSLKMDQVNHQRGVVRVWGKGNKERIIPMGEVASHWLQKYAASSRPALLRFNSDTLFLSLRGRALTRQTFWHRVKLHGSAAQIKASLSPHTLRHAFATHLVNNNADLRVVQLMLGHSDLSSTQIYTHVAQQRMKSLHKAHHPRG